MVDIALESLPIIITAIIIFVIIEFFFEKTFVDLDYEEIIKNTERYEVYDNPEIDEEINSNITVLKQMTSKDEDYASLLLETGILYERDKYEFYKAMQYFYLSSKITHDESYLNIMKKIIQDRYKVENDTITYKLNKLKDLEEIEKELYFKNPNKVRLEELAKKIETEKNLAANAKEFNAKSYLHSMGYKVGKSGLEKQYRQNLLKMLIKEGNISKYQIVEVLKQNIQRFKFSKGKEKAIEDWKEDLIYIEKEL